MVKGESIVQHSEYVVISKTIMGIRIRQIQRVLNAFLLIALVLFLFLHTRRDRLFKSRNETAEEQELYSAKQAKGKQGIKDVAKKASIKVPWRYNLEDDGFMFPKRNRREKFIAYIPPPVIWPKQLQLFENALIFAYLLDRTLLVPPLVESRNESQNLTSKRSFAISTIIDLNLLSKVVSLKEMSLKRIEKVCNSSKAYKICHDHRLGFWVDFIPAVEDIQLWRILRSQRFTAFPIRLDDREVDLMCPGTIQYGNRWGPPMKIKPIIRAIMTELYEREENVILFQGDTLGTRDFRFFDKGRTKIIQKLLIFNVQFSKNVNLLLRQLMKYLGRTYNAILAGPIGEGESMKNELESRLKVNRFIDTSKTLLIVSRRSDEERFNFLKDLGYHLIFKSDISQNIDESGDRKILNDLHDLCITLLCAYASKLITIHGPSQEYFVEHLRLQNVSMRDGLVTHNINVRWAKHTQLPAKDERVLLAKQNTSSHAIHYSANTTGRNITWSKRYWDSKVLTTAKSLIVINSTEIVNKTNDANVNNNSTNLTTTKTKPAGKLDSMVCTFCLHIKKVTGTHGCPTFVRWCH